MNVDDRGVSATLSIVLLFAIVIAGMVAVVTMGATALGDTQQQLDTSRAEKALTQFDSKSAMVALGGTDSQSVSLPSQGVSRYRTHDDSGWMNVTIYNKTSNTRKTVTNVTLGEVTYQQGQDVLSYQGGGVWRQSGANATMISPPEFHYRGKTLTLPIISINGTSDLGSRATIQKSGPHGQEFPNSTADDDFINPLTQGQVNVTVQSDYYTAWGEYFSERTQGDVSYDHARETATVGLVVPFDEEFSHAVATTDPDGLTPEKHKPAGAVTGIDYPSIDQKIEDRIDDCESTPSPCTDVSAGNTITSGGTYYADSYFDGSLTIDNPGDDVTVVINENFNPSNVDITSTHNTTIYLQNELKLKGNSEINLGGDAGDLTIAMHSDGVVNNNGKFQFVGLLYAPGSFCNFNGGAGPTQNVVGGVVCESATFRGQKNFFNYDSGVRNPGLDLSGDVTPLTYLHITSNTVNVTSR